MTAYKSMGFDIKDFPNAYNQYCNEISLPLNSVLTDQEADFVAQTMREILEGNYVKKAPEELVLKRVREGNDADIFAVQELLQMCGEEMFIRYNQLHWATPLSINIIQEEALSTEVYLVYDEKENLVATFHMSENPSMYFDVDKKAMYFQRMAVVPSLWRRGVGTRLLQMVEDRARKDGCECIRCTVYSESHHALWFLQKHGFKTLYKRPSKHFILLCMEKEL